MRACIIRTGALGDFTATVPVLHALRRRATHLSVVANPRYQALFRLADRWIDSDGRDAADLLAGRLPLPDVDLGVAWTATAAGGLRAAGVVDVREGSPRPPPGTSIYHHLWAPLRHLGPWPGVARITADAAALAAIDARLQGVTPFVVAPGSGGVRKRWGLERWRDVAAALPDPVVWVRGPIEEGEAGWGEPVWDDLGLPDLVALATRCRAWLGPDAGPGHVAAAAGAATAVVFTGATDPACWAPPGAKVFDADATAVDVAAWAAAVTA